MTLLGYYETYLNTPSGPSSYRGELRVYQVRQDATLNASTVGWEFGIRQLAGTGRWSNQPNYWSVHINGGLVDSGDLRYNFNPAAQAGLPPMGSYIVISRGEVGIGHNALGVKSVSGWGTFNDTADNLMPFSVGSTDPVFHLTPLSQATVPTITPNPVIEFGSVTIGLPRVDPDFTHDITWVSGSLSGTIGTGLGTGTSWTPPSDILDEWPGRPQAPITITVTTKDGATVVGTRTITLMMKAAPTPPAIGGELHPFDVRARRVEYVGGEWAPTSVIPAIDIQLVDPHSATATCSVTTSDIVQPLDDYSIVDIEIYNGTDWVNPGLRFVLVRVEDDYTDLSRTAKYSGTNFIDYSLGKAFTTRDAKFVQTTTGWIMNDYISAAKSRGWGPRFNMGFTFDDSATGDRFIDRTIVRDVGAGITLAQVLEGLVNDGLAEYRSRYQDGEAYLDLLNPGTGSDWSVAGANPVVNFSTTPLTSAPRRGTMESQVTRVTVAGEGELRRTREKPAFDPNVLGQLEGWVSATGVSDAAEADRIGDTALSESSSPNNERTFEYSPHAVSRHLWPYFTMRPGDWVLIPNSDNTGTERARVSQITISKVPDGISVTVVTGERILSGTGALAKRQQIATGGAIPGGNLTTPSTLDSRIPAAPIITSITSAGYWNPDGAAQAVVTVNYSAVTTSLTGSALTVDYYEIWWRPNVGTPWALRTVSDTTSVEIPGWDINQDAQFRVRGRSIAGVFGSWSIFENHTTDQPDADLDAPNVPTVTTNALGIIDVSWDGEIAGSPAPAHLAHVRAEISDDGLSPWSVFGTPLVSAGSTSIDPGLYRQWYLRLVPVDRLGQDGTASSGVAITTVDPKVDPRVPKAPTGLAATTGGSWSTNGLKLASWVNLTWTAVTQDVNNTTLPIAGYRVWGRLSSETNMREVTVSEVTSLRINDLDPAAAWVFEVEAISHTSISSAPSSTVSITTTATNPAMATPIGVTSSTTKGLFRVAWAGQLTGAIQPPNQFRYAYVEYKTTTGGSWTRAGTTIPRGGGDVTIPNLAVGTAYQARLTVVDGVGVESAKSALTTSLTIVGVDTGDLTTTVTNVINSKAKITYSTSAASGSGTSVGDTWFQRVGSDIIGHWEWSGSAWVARTMSNLSATAIDGKVITGATVQTVAANDEGIKLTGNVFVAYDANGEATFLLDGSTGTVYFANGVISGDALVNGTIQASKLDVGSVVASLIASDLGEQLNLESNESVNIVVGNAVAGVQGDVDDLDSNLTLMQTYYQFGVDGAVITKPGSPFAVRIANDRIEMIANGIVVSYWTAGSMVVPSLVANDTAIIGAHQWRKEGADTTVRAL